MHDRPGEIGHARGQMLATEPRPGTVFHPRGGFLLLKFQSENARWQGVD